jgi:peptidoglycan biosynthesis protein MviN/MurJ (putative lipid II flippase)
MPLEAKAVLALLVGPLVGAVIHVVAQVVSLRRADAGAQPIAEDQEERR